MTPKLIPAKNALILWKPRRKQEDFVIRVLYKTPEMRRPTIYDDWPCSSGCAFIHWAEMDESLMFAACMKILFQEGISNRDKVKMALFEFGKIEELESVRKLYHALYHSEEMTFEGLLASFYGWDFCDEQAR